MKHIILLSFTLVLTFLGIACNGTENPVDTNRQISGYWALQSGLRDKVPTETLEGTWVKIDTNNRFSTNLPVVGSEPVPFEFKKNKLITKGASKMEYIVTNITDSTMTLSFSARGFDFDLNLIRANPDSTEINL